MRRRDVIRLLGAVMTVFPRPVGAQPGKKSPIIGVLWHAGSAEEEGQFYRAVQNGFRDLGYVEGETIRLEHRFPAEQYQRFAAFAAEFVRLPVDVLLPVTAPAAVAAKKATASIPIVFLLVPDPVGSGLVENLGRPGGNATGFSTIATDLAAKRVELLKQAVPGTSRVAILVNASAPDVASRTIAEIQPAAARLGVTIQPIEARLPADLAHAFAVIARDRFDGVAVAPDGMFYNERRRIAELSLKHQLPTVHPSRDTVVAGSFMSYGPDLEAICRRAPAYVDKILKGARRATDQVRARDQRQDRQGARADDPAFAAPAGGSDHTVMSGCPTSRSNGPGARVTRPPAAERGRSADNAGCATIVTAQTPVLRLAPRHRSA